MKSSSPLQILSKIRILNICILIWKQMWAKYDPMVWQNNFFSSKTFGFLHHLVVQAHDDPSSWAGLWTRHHGNVQVQRRLSYSKKIFAIAIILQSTFQLRGQEQGRSNIIRWVPHHDHPCQGEHPLTHPFCWSQLLVLMVINIFSSFLCLTINAV